MKYATSEYSYIEEEKATIKVPANQPVILQIVLIVPFKYDK